MAKKIKRLNLTTLGTRVTIDCGVFKGNNNVTLSKYHYSSLCAWGQHYCREKQNKNHAAEAPKSAERAIRNPDPNANLPTT